MLIDLRKAIQAHGLKVSNAIHVGAHYGQEYGTYKECNIDKIIFIEPQREVFKVLRDKFFHHKDVKLINAACGSKNKENQIMYCDRNNQGQSSSLMRPVDHLTQHPEIIFDRQELVDVYQLDFLIPMGYDFLVMDCQGFELEILKGANEVLKGIETIYLEVNRSEMYEGCAGHIDIENYLNERGFALMETKWAHHRLGWGDAIYKRIK